MCLCKGLGGIAEQHSWGISYNPCPDSHCQFDRDKANREYEQWRKEYFAAIEMQLKIS